ncbi:hypothetical protein HDU92_001402 [Lobulomyces angularis]|nr:hypothetical protein HDU92_001402 [Lobulomyces angularis]
MSIFPKESIKTIAETCGYNLRDEVANVLVQDVEYRLREVLLEAKKFMLHSKRLTLNPEDINSALKMKNFEQMYGYNKWTPNVWKSTSLNQTNLYYLEDQELELDDIINKPLPVIPLDVMYTAHYLAIDGVQPAYLQNPTNLEIQQMKAEINLLTSKSNNETENKNKIDALKKNSNIPPSNEKTLVKQVLGRELTLYFEKITEAILPHTARSGSSTPLSSSQSKLMSETEYREHALKSLLMDPGLQPLVPYFTEFITETVTNNLKNLDVLTSMLKMIMRLFGNPNLFIESQIHQLIPAILTCSISKKLSSTPNEDHWTLRRTAATLLRLIVEKYSNSYPSLQPRLTKTLTRALLDRSKGRGSIYGAIFGLVSMGEQVLRIMVLPNVKFVSEYLLNTENEVEDEVEKQFLTFESEKCLEALLLSILNIVKHDLISKYFPNLENEGPTIPKVNFKQNLKKEEKLDIFKSFKTEFGFEITKRLFTKLDLADDYNTILDQLGDDDDDKGEDSKQQNTDDLMK